MSHIALSLPDFDHLDLGTIISASNWATELTKKPGCVIKKMLNKNNFKMLNFCLIFIILGFLKAKLSWQTANLSKFYLNSIEIAWRSSKVKWKNWGQHIQSVHVVTPVSNLAIKLIKKQNDPHTKLIWGSLSFYFSLGG